MIIQSKDFFPQVSFADELPEDNIVAENPPKTNKKKMFRASENLEKVIEMVSSDELEMS